MMHRAVGRKNQGQDFMKLGPACQLLKENQW